VREVRVHLEDAVVVALQRVAEAGHVGGPQALLAGAVQDVQAGILPGQVIGQRAGAIGRGIVDDEDGGLG
jgi:hypothetical protein